MADPQREELERNIRTQCEGGSIEEATRLALRLYGAEILGWIVGITKDEATAEDICQTFSVALWKGLPQFRWESSLRVWAYRIAWRELIRVQKEQANRREQHIATGEMGQLAHEVTTLRSLLRQKQEQNRLIELRQELPEEAQSLLVLRVDREMSFAEVAKILEITEEGARQKFKRAKDQLKEMARKEGLLT